MMIHYSTKTKHIYPLKKIKLLMIMAMEELYISIAVPQVNIVI